MSSGPSLLSMSTASGTHISGEHNPNYDSPTPSVSKGEISEDSEEQALECHEVIELQTFSERKAWIDEKIKFLEKLPPIEVFVGLDAIRSSAEEVPGLPTRAELQRWVVEHDLIEKETEIFDTGELRKLRNFTKAATQRNLSPQDTDLIELTLTTIYELDKLLHLLRDRSENLELLGVRLTWEEHRTGAWVERRNILSDMQHFLEHRARWSPSAYDTLINSEAPLRRKNSVASLGSVTSESSALSSPALSRSNRFKLAEILSRDAAQFVGRVTSLRHGKIAAAGKALDNLIDSSRKAVPEELLDEQDRLEERGINEMENIGKFAMNVVMQWRKADEIFVETMKDQVSAQNLLEEIETAKLHHPTLRQSASYISRADGLIKRLTLRRNPSSSTTFPRPLHPLFSGQHSSNESLGQALSLDISNAMKLARSVDAAAKEYRASQEAVAHVEALCIKSRELSTALSSILDRLEEGIRSDEGDGTPPDLSSESCLEPSRHSVFLALLPMLVQESQTTSESAKNVLRNSHAALLGLNSSGIDPEFKQHATSDFKHLGALLLQTEGLKAKVVDRVARLREARKIWSAMNLSLKELEVIQRQVGDAMETNKWHQQAARNGRPLTPDSPIVAAPPPSALPPNVSLQLLRIEERLSTEVANPLSSISATLEPPLKAWLNRSFTGLRAFLEGIRQMTGLLDSVRMQSAVMAQICDEFGNFQIRLDDLRLKFDSEMQNLLNGKATYDEACAVEVDLASNITELQIGIQNFTDGLPSQIPFISQRELPPVPSSFSHKRFSSGDLKLGVDFDKLASLELPFDLQSLDDGVRADSNSFAMKLGGGLQSLHQKRNHFHLARMAKEVDLSLVNTVKSINQVSQDLDFYKRSLSPLLERGSDLDALKSLRTEFVEFSQENRSRIARSFSPIRDLLRKMDAAPGSHDSAVHEVLYLARNRAVDDAELKFNTWGEAAAAFKTHLSELQYAEEQRLEHARMEEERRQLAERQRLAEEEALRLKAEREKLDEEARQRAIEERIAEERRVQEETKRIAAAEAEKVRLEADRIKAEEALREEEQRKAHERELQSERARLVLEETERSRLEREALQAEKLRIQAETEKLRLERERMEVEAILLREENERRESEERERLVREEGERLRLEKERLVAEQNALAKEKTLRLEQEVLETEKKRKDEEEFKRRELESARHESQLNTQAKERQAEVAQLRQALIKAEEAQHEKSQQVNPLGPKTRPGVQGRVQAAKEKLEHKSQPLFDSKPSASKALATKPRSAKLRVKAVPAGKVLHPPTLDPLDEDVFGSGSASSILHELSAENTADLRAQIASLRKRLWSISINELARPRNSSSSDLLPNEAQVKEIDAKIQSISNEAASLPSSSSDPTTCAELRSIRADLDAATQLLQRLFMLAAFSESVVLCDAVLSDLLDHIDSFPATPQAVHSSSRGLSVGITPEDHLSARLLSTRSTIDQMTAQFNFVADDPRVIAERKRILQTWSELEDMANDRIGGRKSRSPSVVGSAPNSSGRNSSASMFSNVSTSKQKRTSYSNLSLGSRGRGRLLTPTHSESRRSSGSGQTRSRPASQMSNLSSNRAVSGPLRSTSSSLYGTTFASRQRTASLSSTTPSVLTPTKRPPVPPLPPLAKYSRSKSSASPTPSEATSHSRSVRMSPSRSSKSSNTSTWSRAPRVSFSNLPNFTTPPRHKAAEKKTYVADPNSKLDVAVGDVVNKLPVNINVEVVAETWKDQSGKYWIGDQDPKLCFCRILRSRTVMVRVGGGWTELSKFIKDHFADLFRLIPESPPRPGLQEEKWISSNTLLEAPEIVETPLPPSTPEPKVGSLPYFSLSTPSGRSPQSMRSTSSSGSPLTPLQFMRRADLDVLQRPVTPSRGQARPRVPSSTNTPVKSSVWKP